MHKASCNNCKAQLAKTQRGTYLNVMVRQETPGRNGHDLKGHHFCNYHCLAEWSSKGAEAERRDAYLPRPKLTKEST